MDQTKEQLPTAPLPAGETETTAAGKDIHPVEEILGSLLDQALRQLTRAKEENARLAEKCSALEALMLSMVLKENDYLREKLGNQK